MYIAMGLIVLAIAIGLGFFLVILVDSNNNAKERGLAEIDHKLDAMEAMGSSPF
jgi:hypothetical protein